MKSIPRRIFGILAFAAGILLVMLEINSYRGVGAISWFWMFIAAFAIVLGLVDLIARSR